AGEFVGVDQGTGLVHIARGHGEEDYELGKSLGLKMYNPVDDAGRFAADVEHFAGLTVWDANPKIIEHLKSVGMLIAQRPLDHTYPHCWRCKNPTLFRATEQWFIDLNKGGFRAAAPERRNPTAGATAKRPTSSPSGSTPAAATRRCSRRGPSSTGRPSSTWKARTSTAGGFSPRCSSRLARVTRRPTRAW